MLLAWGQPMLEVTDTDIAYAESVFLRPGETFDDERRAVIRSQISGDVLACPGSGKTTALLAKLAILATKMPLPDHRGLCVLTHTNVAIDEIRARLGPKGEVLLKHPNFFGTIQSFVDRFLAIPAAIQYYGKRPVRIDAEVHDYEIAARFNATPANQNTRFFLESKSRGRGAYECLKWLRLDLIGRTIVNDILDTKALLKSAGSESYKLLFPLKEGMLRDGILHFDDAYSLALKYVNDYHDLLQPVFSRRFAFVFVDEMQDTDSCQLSLIDRIFDCADTVVQKIGDLNQAIFTSAHVGAAAAWKPSADCLQINGSKRFSQAIADVAKTCCIRRQEMQGNQSIPDLPVYILVYDDATAHKVLSQFGDLIISHGLHAVARARFRAVGWVGKPSEKGRTLPYYWPAFTNKRARQRLEFDSLQGYLQKPGGSDAEPTDAEHYRSALMRGLARVMRVAGVKDASGHWYTATSVDQLLEEHHSALHAAMLIKATEWILQIADGGSVTTDVTGFVTTVFMPALGIAESPKLRSFILGPPTGESTAAPATQDRQHGNIYTHAKDGAAIEIELDTIHGVKGQTHTATLYLETSYRSGHDVARVQDFLTGATRQPQPIQACSMRMAYVAMTRPTHLLCIAAHRESVLEYADKLTEIGFAVKEL